MTWAEVVEYQRDLARRMIEQPLTEAGEVEHVRLANEAVWVLQPFIRERRAECSDEEFRAAYNIHRDALIAWSRRRRSASIAEEIEQRRAEHVAICTRAIATAPAGAQEVA